DGFLLSFEFFPPKDHRGFAVLEKTVSQLRILEPDFVTVTYGAGGRTRARTLALAELLREIGFRPVMPHLTCISTAARDLSRIVDEIAARGFRNIMALRGDPPAEGGPRPEGLPHAINLVRLIRSRHPDICIGVAGYPETHPEAPDPDTDVRHLKEKLEAGADFVITQLFFDNRFYLQFVERCRRHGISQPIIPGLLPAVSLPQVERIMQLCRSTTFPPDLRSALEKVRDDPVQSERIGLEWTRNQMAGLFESGAPGVHLYILNRTRTALAPLLRDFLAAHRRA
ncbi:MAG TPA: methylenetetrahydrofolate reductase [NAD(P)H], partial [Kiritimatiellae bacterium]|nr:methylenetetrahydrofolate reductase [NAD(P)H] [Kiritimatiellia bacterium]